MSYGAYADDLLTTLRRRPDAEAGRPGPRAHEPRAVHARAEGHVGPDGDARDVLARVRRPGRLADGAGPDDAVLDVATESMVPISHILWSHLWLGIATDAFDRARAFVARAKSRPDVIPPTAVRLSQLISELSLLRAEVHSGLRDFTDANAGGDRESLSTMATMLRFNNLKIAASEQAPRVCQGAMNVCGIVGYKNDTPFSVGRHLRDTMSACLMVANDRIHQTNASLLLIAKDV